MMMNRVIYTILSILIVTILYSCTKNLLDPLVKPVPLKVSLSSQSLVMGDELTIEIFVDEEDNAEAVSPEEFDVYLSAKAGTRDVAGEVFENMPEKVTFPKGEKRIAVKVPILKEGITSTYTLDLTTFVRGYKISGATQSIIVSDFHYTIVGLKNNPDKEVQEGSDFVLTASVGVPSLEDIVVNIAAKVGEEDEYENLPVTLTIPKGATSIESENILLKEDMIYTGNKNLTLLISSNATVHPIYESELIILKRDIDAPLGALLQDERWVYDNPSIPFMSSRNKAAVETWYDKDPIEMHIGDPHPKISGWNFYNALEFHAIPAAYANVTPNTFGNYVPKGFAAQNTTLVQTVMAVNNDKYSTITSEGYLKMWAVKEPTQATGGASGMRNYGFSALYSSKFNANNATFIPQHTRIYPGMRIEVRARVRGEKNGFNCAIWLQGNAQSSLAWPLYGEIDILENPVGSKTGTNMAYQTFHLSDQGMADYNPHSVVNMPNMSDWNIYWVEFVNENTVTMGINGQDNVTLRKSDMKDPSLWPFDKVINPEGFHFLLTLGAPSEWGLGSPTPAGWDSAFADILYNDSKTNPRTPRLELDWIRYYTNAVYDIGNKQSAYTHNTANATLY
ncbi:DUF5006 domain-containing protein [Sphingobacterium chuzhouense]|uniref:DUF5006 domain-containing protein n=2 Tax=Sphingobacterium chuzhouense TaxID=1742264 RepID=A0ABR7XNS6_9SPHI|nr:DUF5006 domain-containing protein [Sphingobacterium chuzhouense]MBD1420816.1 DUF5006 domain-containing protein [Sphingobacterium chuzhouense]